jgi:carbonic anhydrase
MTAVELEMVIAAQSEPEEDAKKVGRVRRGLHRCRSIRNFSAADSERRAGRQKHQNVCRRNIEEASKQLYKRPPLYTASLIANVVQLSSWSLPRKSSVFLEKA